MKKTLHPSVLVLSNFFPPEVSAASVRIESFVNAFAERQIEVSVIASSRLKKGFSIRTSSEQYSSYVKVYRFDASRIGFLIDPLIFLFFSVRAFAVAFSKKPKVIISSVPPGEMAVAAWFVSRLLRVPVIIDVRDVISPRVHKVKKLNNWLFSILKHVYRHADTVLAVTDTLATHLHSLGVQEDKIRTIRNGADTSIFHPIPQEEFERARKETKMPLDETVLVYVADLHDNRHRLDIVLKSLKLLKDADGEANLIVIGDGIYRQHFETIANALGLERVRFLGEMRGKMLARHILLADVGLVSYSNDEEISLPIFPVKAYEYLACGKPVIAAMPLESELSKFLRNRRVGLSVKAEDPVALSNSILLFMTHDSSVISMNENAARVSSMLDRKAQARDFVDFVLERYLKQ